MELASWTEVPRARIRAARHSDRGRKTAGTMMMKKMMIWKTMRTICDYKPVKAKTKPKSKPTREKRKTIVKRNDRPKKSTKRMRRPRKRIEPKLQKRRLP